MGLVLFFLSDLPNIVKQRSEGADKFGGQAVSYANCENKGGTFAWRWRKSGT
jgi:hypothetical protein